MLTPGTIIHKRYRIERPVGQGAMGTVYAAVDLRLGHTVALKHTRVPGPVGAAALDREAQILTHLADFGLARGQLFQTNLAGQRTTLPSWLRWVSGHTLTCAILALMSVLLAPPVGVGGQLLLAALLCVLHRLTSALQQRDASRFLLALAALRRCYPGCCSCR
jgi:serine/threonine-protein kinase